MSFDKTKNRTVHMLCRTDGGNDVYIGSTSLPLDVRFKQHKYNAGNPSRLKYYGNSKLYKKMREVGVHRWKITPLITIPCDRTQICEFEQVWIKALNANLNTFSLVNENLGQRGTMIKRYRENVGTKRYYCELCNVACGSNSALKKHFDTYKHFMNWVWDID